MAFIEMAYGKPPQRTEITGANGGAIIVDWDSIDNNQD
jgi:hypothetical protein